MKHRDDAQQWVHTDEEEKLHGFDHTPEAHMPLSLRKLLAELRAERDAAVRERDEARASHAQLATVTAERDRFRELLTWWLNWEGRGEDEPHPKEIETAAIVGHTPDCELVEYGVCTCTLAATAPRPLSAGPLVAGAVAPPAPQIGRGREHQARESLEDAPVADGSVAHLDAARIRRGP